MAVDAMAAALPAATFLPSQGWAIGIATALVLAVCWVGALGMRGAYRMSVLARSPITRLLLRSWASYAGIVALLVVGTGRAIEPRTLVVLLALPLAASHSWRALVCSRVVARRRQALSLSRVLLVGRPGEVDDAVRYLTRGTGHEFVVVGACAVGEGDLLGGTPVVSRIPVAGEAEVDDQRVEADREAVLDAARVVGADVVMVLPGAGLTPVRLRHLVWALHENELDVVQVPGLVEVEGHRIEARAIDGLTVLLVRKPKQSGWPLVVKSAFDRVLGTALLLFFLPVLVVIALAVVFDTRGPVFYRHTRLGRRGVPFTMWKFRSMVTGADLHKAELLLENQNDGLMFKIRRDPRVTRVGRRLRRFSLDELPQLVNVVRGDMSLVGPRPPLPDEVAGYDTIEVRRLRVKPGMTGLWQVSGRSDLSWDETVALDLRYVDNWTPFGDLRLLMRTAQAVISGRGAY